MEFLRFLYITVYEVSGVLDISETSNIQVYIRFLVLFISCHPSLSPLTPHTSVYYYTPLLL